MDADLFWLAATTNLLISLRFVHVGGLVVLAWLAVRTLHRIQVLVQDEKADRGR